MNEDRQTKIIYKLYSTLYGRAILSVITKPWFSRLAGGFMESGLSTCMINRFARQNNIDMSHYLPESYECFNDFFTRRIKPEHRPIATAEHELIAPCDGRLSVYSISSDNRVEIKGHSYNIEELVRDAELANQYDGGLMLVFRLTVSDYHRYHYPVHGQKSENVKIDGVLHTVNPIAAKARRIYFENAREHFTIDSENFGKLLFIQVGALLVGKIHNHHGSGRVVKGDEAGFFKYGGSTVVMCIEKEAARIHHEFLRWADKDVEVPIRMGQSIGVNSSLAE